MQTEKSTQLQAFQFNATSQHVRSLLVENEPHFVAKDVCNILELSDTNKALSRLDDDEKLTRNWSNTLRGFYLSVIFGQTQCPLWIQKNPPRAPSAFANATNAYGKSSTTLPPSTPTGNYKPAWMSWHGSFILLQTPYTA